MEKKPLPPWLFLVLVYLAIQFGYFVHAAWKTFPEIRHRKNRISEISRALPVTLGCLQELRIDILPAMDPADRIDFVSGLNGLKGKTNRTTAETFAGLEKVAGILDRSVARLSVDDRARVATCERTSDATLPRKT